MFYRKILDKLKLWKKREANKPLVLRGARQVGKSTLVNEFSKEYKTYISLNLERSSHVKFFREYGDDVKKILEAIMFEFNIGLVDFSDTLLFIDEIQEEPKAISLLRYFYEDLPELDVIAAGSLLEFAIKDVASFPVGRVEQLAVHPMNFEEFLMAIGEESALKYLNTVPTPDLAFGKLLRLYNDYIIIGGMPEVVKMYVDSGKIISGLDTVYSSIWDTYLEDVEKYGDDDNEIQIIRHILTTAPYVRDRITFNGFGNSQYSSRKVSDAFRKLHKSGIIKLIYPTTNTEIPLSPNYKRKPKIQFLDTGILNYSAGIQAQLIKLNDFNSIYKGYIVNHMIFQEMIAASDKVHFTPNFWTRENANSNAEVDLVYPYINKVIPVEIKSGSKGRLRSLHEFIDRCDHQYAIRYLANKVSLEDIKSRTDKKYKLLNLPYFTSSKIEKWIEWFQNEV